MTGTTTDSATIENDLSDLRIVISYMQLNQEALMRELQAARNNI